MAGTKYIYSNGTYDVSNYAKAYVDVSSGSGMQCSYYEYTSTIESSSSNIRTINCGFTPDVVVIEYGDSYSNVSYSNFRMGIHVYGQGSGGGALASTDRPVQVTNGFKTVYWSKWKDKPVRYRAFAY